MSEQTIEERIRELVPTLDRATLEQVLEIVLGINGWLDDHHPNGREGGVPRFSCTGDVHHRCSARNVHADDCDGTCGKTKPCVEDRSHIWCHCSGFDCPDCKAWDDLYAIETAARA